MQLLASALAGCMAIDVVHILTRGRLPPTALRARLEGRRASEEPRRLVAVALRFTVLGEIPDEKVERAIALSKQKYCSVWHSLDPAIGFETSFEVVRQPLRA